MGTCRQSARLHIRRRKVFGGKREDSHCQYANLSSAKKYTPEGYVDLDLPWFSPDKVIVARAKENKEWDEGPVPTMFTSLYAINLKTEEQKQILYGAIENLLKQGLIELSKLKISGEKLM